MSTAVLPHMQHLVVILRLDALLEQSVLGEVAVVFEVWNMLLQKEAGLDIVFQNVHMVILWEFS